MLNAKVPRNWVKRVLEVDNKNPAVLELDPQRSCQSQSHTLSKHVPRIRQEETVAKQRQSSDEEESQSHDKTSVAFQVAASARQRIQQRNTELSTKTECNAASNRYLPLAATLSTAAQVTAIAKHRTEQRDIVAEGDALSPLDISSPFATSRDISSSNHGSYISQINNISH
mmetsp:Transcript_23127/g.33574  ORF Transcript_23127/g.33574 Transcript_23127/m.33574 type:complete len:171 (-) Transcript_23127:1918-2430(-)|eukprot:15364822-Ditylum_brightwellii.AAC.1